MIRKRMGVIAATAALAAVFGTGSAHALNTTAYSFSSASGHCEMDISWYYNNGWEQEYTLRETSGEKSNGGCTAWFNTSDKGVVGRTSVGTLGHSQYSTYDGPNVYVTPYVSDYAGTTHGDTR
ncbi:hypothetical protein [Streptacidiphilus rugosus]|uniref:hypothetical protein n=1 Tax=Streptacidiphilus rugosus TaxID=405783 RepID=UPI00056B5FA0|nr:hypothetical protein [Streptacidiphilus rugosus]